MKFDIANQIENLFLKKDVSELYAYFIMLRVNYNSAIKDISLLELQDCLLGVIKPNQKLSPITKLVLKQFMLVFDELGSADKRKYVEVLIAFLESATQEPENLARAIKDIYASRNQKFLDINRGNAILADYMIQAAKYKIAIQSTQIFAEYMQEIGLLQNKQEANNLLQYLTVNKKLHGTTYANYLQNSFSSISNEKYGPHSFLWKGIDTQNIGTMSLALIAQLTGRTFQDVIQSYSLVALEPQSDDDLQIGALRALAELKQTQKPVIISSAWKGHAIQTVLLPIQKKDGGLGVILVDRDSYAHKAQAFEISHYIQSIITSSDIGIKLDGVISSSEFLKEQQIDPAGCGVAGAYNVADTILCYENALKQKKEPNFILEDIRKIKDSFIRPDDEAKRYQYLTEKGQEVLKATRICMDSISKFSPYRKVVYTDPQCNMQLDDKTIALNQSEIGGILEIPITRFNDVKDTDKFGQPPVSAQDINTGASRKIPGIHGSGVISYMKAIENMWYSNAIQAANQISKLDHRLDIFADTSYGPLQEEIMYAVRNYSYLSDFENKFREVIGKSKLIAELLTRISIGLELVYTDQNITQVQRDALVSKIALEKGNDIYVCQDGTIERLQQVIEYIAQTHASGLKAAIIEWKRATIEVFSSYLTNEQYYNNNASKLQKKFIDAVSLQIDYLFSQGHRIHNVNALMNFWSDVGFGFAKKEIGRRWNIDLSKFSEQDIRDARLIAAEFLSASDLVSAITDRIVGEMEIIIPNGFLTDDEKRIKAEIEAQIKLNQNDKKLQVAENQKSYMLDELWNNYTSNIESVFEQYGIQKSKNALLYILDEKYQRHFKPFKERERIIKSLVMEALVMQGYARGGVVKIDEDNSLLFFEENYYVNSYSSSSALQTLNSYMREQILLKEPKLNPEICPDHYDKEGHAYLLKIAQEYDGLLQNKKMNDMAMLLNPNAMYKFYLQYEKQNLSKKQVNESIELQNENSEDSFKVAQKIGMMIGVSLFGKKMSKSREKDVELIIEHLKAKVLPLVDGSCIKVLNQKSDDDLILFVGGKQKLGSLARLYYENATQFTGVGLITEGAALTTGMYKLSTDGIQINRERLDNITKVIVNHISKDMQPVIGIANKP
jgi:hypothetical protein